MQRQVFRSEDLLFQKNIFRFANCNPYEKITIRIACFKIEQRRKRAAKDMNAISLIKENDNLSLEQQSKLLADAEMVATGIIKFDIFEESDRAIEDF